MKKIVSGFTIVELLIVIVVIAILAAVSVVAYTGIQQRARNAQTVSAVNAYVKALNLYKVDNGSYPELQSCLGEGYDSGYCEEWDGEWGATFEDGDGLNSTYLSPYLGSSVPTPATNLGTMSSELRIGGAIYAAHPFLGGRAGINLYHQGSGDCPTISGLRLTNSDDFSDNSGKWCFYITT